MDILVTIAVIYIIYRYSSDIMRVTQKSGKPKSKTPPKSKSQRKDVEYTDYEEIE